MNEQASNQIRGHKANLSNPNTSPESKDNSRQVIDELSRDYDPANALEAGGPEAYHDSLGGKNPGNYIGGHKATLKNPNTSEEAKERSRKVLDELQSDDVD